MSSRLYDAHNHLQDARLAGQREPILAAARRENICRMVVNGTCEEDWPAVLELARGCPEVIPSFGYHPWHVKVRSPDWQAALLRGQGYHLLDARVGATWHGAGLYAGWQAFLGPAGNATGPEVGLAGWF